jgi:hypothetical protein
LDLAIVTNNGSAVKIYYAAICLMQFEDIVVGKFRRLGLDPRSTLHLNPNLQLLTALALARVFYSAGVVL